MAEHLYGEVPATAISREKDCQQDQIDIVIDRLRAHFDGEVGERAYTIENDERVKVEAMMHGLGTIYRILHRHNIQPNNFGQGDTNNYEEVESCYIVTDDENWQTLGYMRYDLDGERALLDEMARFYDSGPTDAEKLAQKEVFRTDFNELNRYKLLGLGELICVTNATERQATDLNRLIRKIENS